MRDHRKVFIFDRVAKGWDPKNALLVGWALHPFESNLRPSRSIEKRIRKESRKFARECRDSFEGLDSTYARFLLGLYCKIAEEDPSSPYPAIWRGVIKSASDGD